MRATVRDVAALAGVSPKTVSNVVNGGVVVRPETRERVERAVAELDYVPNLSARGLRNGRSGAIALTLPEMGSAYSAELAQSFVELARERGWVVQLEQTGNDPARERELVSRARAHLVDGLILNPVSLSASVLASTEGLPPTVVIGEVEPEHVDQVHVDSRAAAEQVTEHLIAHGHRRIAVVGASPEGAATATSELRERGYTAALTAAGITPDPSLRVPLPAWTTSSAATTFAAWLDERPLPDAVFAFTDSIAFGVLHVLAARGVRVPEQVSVIGFDDVDAAAYAIPSLSTVSFDRRAFATAALDLLTRRIADRGAAPETVVVPHRIVERASVGDRPR
ncbi:MULTISPECIES: LacI family DNA-binding transcriptional regulator [Curtobacterium]|uniref:LacI family DNA-binding transcriptional regulator n=1 Tax=Curtobacterium TaxID=2034 RepID=UPI0015F675CE|nr:MULTISPECIES: LacI family DNA-binding transcriptional regulator [Curtobacterium]MBO9039933.1 LacI family DNA-binding transcriptional regulator [Curtobacterium flaccumfaciens pv. flaccumfaciens]MCS6562535.1 LacI family transcriptional regulator [Curtobacterium flaccumfaciens pv. poinsettiae]UXN28585.1 LacI family transcriptional regulator [Curtobacterium flaccumfaciens]